MIETKIKGWIELMYACKPFLLLFLILSTFTYSKAEGKWEVLPIKTPSLKMTDTLFDVFFASPERGWVLGWNGSLNYVLVTNDGGLTWNPEWMDSTCSIHKGMFFINADTAYLFGDGGLVARSKNGSWKRMECSIKGNVVDLQFIDSQHGWLVTENPLSLLRTDDGGIHWESTFDFNKKEVSTLGWPVRPGLFFDSKSDGWVYYGSAVWHSTDGGKSWQEQFMGYPMNWIESSIDSNRFVIRHFDSLYLICQFDGEFSYNRDAGLISADHGAHFSAGELLGEINFFLNKQYGWTLTMEGNLKSTADGGNSWNSQQFPSVGRFYAMHFFDTEHGWIVGNFPGIVKFTGRELRIIQPSPGGAFTIGGTLDVVWKLDSAITDVSISLSYDDGKQYTVYRTSTKNDGRELLRIAANAQPSATCKIKIAALDGSLVGLSRNFTIVKGTAAKTGVDAISMADNPYVVHSQLCFTTSQTAPLSLEIFDLAGKCRYRHLQNSLQGWHKIPLPSAILPKGFLLLRLTINGSVYLGYYANYESHQTLITAVRSRIKEGL